MTKIFSTLFCLIALSSLAQIGRDGAAVITVTNTQINNYTSANANISAGSTTLSVTSGGAFSAGDLIYIIQMQGASINTYPEAINPTNFKPDDFNFGKITNYNNAGRNEYAEVFAVTGNILTVSCPLKYNYSIAGKVQVVWVPRYTSLTVNTGGSISCPQWNGTTGGVIAAEVNGNVTVNNGARISASGLGFRGGAYTNRTASNNGGGSWGSTLRIEGAYKGESIAGDTAMYRTICGTFGKAAPANGGGGGTVDNAGGGGGANAGDTNLYRNGFGVPDISVAGYITAWNLEAAGNATVVSSGGGRGGYTSANSTSSPLTVAPGNTAWSADNRRVQNGLGGRPLDYNTGRLFFGGGGGAGESNNSFGSAGGNGGGIVNIICYGTVSGSGEISANGQNGYATNTASIPINECSGRDGAGGAGGGGAIYINANSTVNTVSITANGGTGGYAELKSGYVFTNSAQAYGPGGGGGGGYIGITPNAAVLSANGGSNGIFRYLSGNENSQIDNLFPANGATSGGIGKITNTITPNYTLTTISNQTICVGNTVSLIASSNNPSASINWYNAAAGGTLLASGTNTYSPAVFATPGTYTVYAGSCPGTYRKAITITVNSGLAISVNSPTICAGQSVLLTANSTATSYTWSTGQSTSTISVTPAGTTVYTVSGSNGACSGSQTATVTISSAFSIALNSATICAGQSAILTPTSTATSYTWSTGQTTATISVSPAATTVYTVNGTSGLCSGSQTATVSISAGFGITVNSATVCAGQAALLTASGASTYTWSTGQQTATLNVSPSATTIYTVTGTVGTCTGTGFSTVTVNTLPVLAINSPSAGICAGQSGTLTVSGASTYTWTNSSNPTTSNSATLSINPSVATTYSVMGTNANGCTNSIPSVITVSVIANPTVTVNSATICPMSFAVLTATGAVSYSWNTGAATTFIHPAPSVTTEYTVTGFVGNCRSAAVATVVVLPEPSIIATVNTTIGCAPLCISFTETTASPTYSVQYNFGDGSSGSLSNPTHCYSSAGTFTASVTITEVAFGCSETYPIPTPFIVYSKPTAAFAIQEGNSVSFGSTVHLINQSSSNAITSNWTLCNSVSNSTDASFTASDTGLCCITLIVTSNLGCMDTATQCIRVMDEAVLYIPNVFTPNGDGKNDVFKIKATGVKSLSCTIYDRWGIKMYDWDDLNGFWDGKTTSGVPVSDGSYFFIINFIDTKDASRTEKGFLSLFRD